MNPYHIDSFKELKAYIQGKLKSGIDIKEVEDISNYSYRNINRIFHALQGETIGKYIKRLRLEKAAEYLVYSDHSVSEIAYELGFNELAIFSKAFKKKYNISPTDFRKNSSTKLESIKEKLEDQEFPYEKLEYEIENLPGFNYLFLERQGDYEDLEGIENSWEEFLSYAKQHELLSERSVLFGSILDDNDISETIHCRYRCCLILNPGHDFQPTGFFQLGIHQAQPYLKFIHVEGTSSSESTYRKIYAQWMDNINKNIADKPVLEFYHFNSGPHSQDVEKTEIHIPIE